LGWRGLMRVFVGSPRVTHTATKGFRCDEIECERTAVAYLAGWARFSEHERAMRLRRRGWRATTAYTESQRRARSECISGRPLGFGAPGRVLLTSGIYFFPRPANGVPTQRVGGRRPAGVVDALSTPKVTVDSKSSSRTAAPGTATGYEPKAVEGISSSVRRVLREFFPRIFLPYGAEFARNFRWTAGRTNRLHRAFTSRLVRTEGKACRTGVFSKTR